MWYVSDKGEDVPECGKTNDRPCMRLEQILNRCCTDGAPQAELRIVTDKSVTIDRQVLVRNTCSNLPYLMPLVSMQQFSFGLVCLFLSREVI